MLVYGTKVVVPTEIGLPSYRIINLNSPKSDLMRRLDLDLVEEVRENAILYVVAYQYCTIRFYNRRVKSSNLKEKDYIMKKFIQKGNKIEVDWHDPYHISVVIRSSTYHLETLEGEQFKNL